MKGTLIGTVVILIILVVGAAWFISERTPQPTTTGTQQGIAPGEPNGQETVSITIKKPVAGSTVGKTIEISGKAPGTWFFEASFPIKLVAEDGRIIGTSTAQAQGDWMTTELVPFTATMHVREAAGTNATLVFMKDNPSGLPENAGSATIPLEYKP